MYFRRSNDILVIWSIDIPWEDLWNSYLKKLFEIHGFGPLKSWMDLAQIQILMVLSHPNKEFEFGPSNPNPWGLIHPIQTDKNELHFENRMHLYETYVAIIFEPFGLKGWGFSTLPLLLLACHRPNTLTASPLIDPHVFVGVSSCSCLLFMFVALFV